MNIVITGGNFSGKRTFINSIREREAYDGGLIPASSYFGRVRLTPDITLFLFPAPGARPLKILNTILDDHGYLGAVVLVDSTRPEEFAETTQTIRTIYNDGMPLIVAANKQDLPEAVPLTDLRDALSLPDDIPLLPCRAKERDSVKVVLEGLFAQILNTLNSDDEEPTQSFEPPQPPPAPPPPPARPKIKPLRSRAGN